LSTVFSDYLELLSEIPIRPSKTGLFAANRQCFIPEYPLIKLRTYIKEIVLEVAEIDL